MRIRKIFLFIPAVLLGASCIQNSLGKPNKTLNITPKVETNVDRSFNYPEEFIASDFDHPVGKGYYNAQKYGVNTHLGEDWNAVTGGNTDLGAPIYSVANGYVKYAQDHGGGWGNVIRINHKLPSGKLVESLYAHCDTILVKPNSWVKKGTQIGTIGTANGRYFAHLHLEMRDSVTLPIGRGYSKNTAGYLDPTEFIRNH